MNASNSKVSSNPDPIIYFLAGLMGLMMSFPFFAVTLDPCSVVKVTPVVLVFNWIPLYLKPLNLKPFHL